MWTDLTFTPRYSSGTCEGQCRSSNGLFSLSFSFLIQWFVGKWLDICASLTVCVFCFLPYLIKCFQAVDCIRDVLASEEGLCLFDSGRPEQSRLHQRQTPEAVLLEGKSGNFIYCYSKIVYNLIDIMLNAYCKCFCIL